MEIASVTALVDLARVLHSGRVHQIYRVAGRTVWDARCDLTQDNHQPISVDVLAESDVNSLCKFCFPS